MTQIIMGNVAPLRVLIEEQQQEIEKLRKEQQDKRAEIERLKKVLNRRSVYWNT